MKSILIITLFLTTNYYVQGQTSDTVKSENKTKIFETAPEPKGGMSGFLKFLSSEIKYPKDARKQKMEGQVLVEFVVSSDGTVRSESVRVIQGVFESIDNEAKRVVISSPNWKPGTRNGQPIDMRMVIPIFFRL
jgi:protein TonB